MFTFYERLDMTNLKSTLALLITSLTLVACGGNSIDSHSPQLRAVHLSPDAPAVDIGVGDTIPITNVTYREASGFLSVDEGNTNIKVLVAGTDTAVIDATLPLAQDMKYTVIAANTLENNLIETLIIQDDINSPAAGNSAITVVHGSPAANAATSAVDVYVTAPDAALPASPLLAAVTFKTISDELEVPAGDYRVRITPAASTSVVYDSGTITLVDGVEYVAIAADDIKSSSLVGLMILTDLESTQFLNVDNASQ